MNLRTSHSGIYRRDYHLSADSYNLKVGHRISLFITDKSARRFIMYTNNEQFMNKGKGL
jgi:hypothetical protein